MSLLATLKLHIQNNDLSINDVMLRFCLWLLFCLLSIYRKMDVLLDLHLVRDKAYDPWSTHFAKIGIAAFLFSGSCHVTAMCYNLHQSCIFQLVCYVQVPPKSDGHFGDNHWQQEILNGNTYQ